LSNKPKIDYLKRIIKINLDDIKNATELKKGEDKQKDKIYNIQLFYLTGHFNKAIPRLRLYIYFNAQMFITLN
jgi:hypothetical protein